MKQVRLRFFKSSGLKNSAYTNQLNSLTEAQKLFSFESLLHKFLILQKLSFFSY
jgi:hypothetical protein